MAENVWILGIHMTKFGKHKDKDTIDLASEAARGALADAGLPIQDVGVLGAGNLMGELGFGQRLQKQIGQTGTPVFNVGNACATAATALRVAIKAGEAEVGLAVGAEMLSGAGLLSGGVFAPSETWTPQGRQGAIMPLEGRTRTGTTPGVFAQISLEYGRQYGGERDRCRERDVGAPRLHRAPSRDRPGQEPSELTPSGDGIRGAQ